ncbi:N-acetyllactosaminide beta-1,3-N-acetylglucosaminyltransferase 3-like [Colossoma macropomum]|uniref:N-acetyllactosaminide beta-1,3-N-acetylglucosaminyltransferase 3-like n=1 Tax=Colossoma macropomum TaxID=42526 RepID=UPI001864CC62|nr:N-acetyllactosaminide beta-1,3-N-acetylglucosaminyltransferase 3-like [Colossoma macropomum]XP_036433999.1 N-acetyllactosaminide beta-1,3-N-acetylglucosaminyltransferase 3-like [Colossoma macropomum]
MKMVQSISRIQVRRWKLEMASVFIAGTLCLIILVRTYLQDKSQEEPALSGYERNLELNAGMPQAFPSLPPKCEQNSSVSNISGFSSLPQNIQDFLYYRHCRHFPMLLNIPDKCGGPERSSDVFLFLVIKSSPPNYERREVLRKTWAAERLQNGVWIRTVFISGTVGQSFEKQRMNKLLEVENREHKDILQWDFHDSFFNLTLKQILFFEWMERFCPNAHFLLNGDDDIFANTDNMVVYLQGLGDDGANKHLFVGHLIQYVGPIRNEASKYYVPVQVQESDRYPPYCGGGGFLLSRFTAKTIYNMSHSITILPIDDVYMGMCLEKAGLKPSSHMGVRTAGLHIPSKVLDPYDPCYYREIILVHRFLPHQIYIMWHEVHQQDLKCGKTLTAH